MNIKWAENNDVSLESIKDGDVFMFAEREAEEYYVKTARFDARGYITVVNLHDGSVAEFPSITEVSCVKHKLVIE